MDEIRLKVCDFVSLFDAMNECKKGVMWKDSVAGWVKNGLVNCFRLSTELLNGTYKIDKYSEFTIHEPKTREIVSTRFKDRVFQRSLCDNYLYQAITRSFIHDNCACQTGKGTDFARSRLACHMQRFWRSHGLDGYALKCDIKSYFANIRHDVAKAAIRKRVKNDWVYACIADVIDSFSRPENPGVGLGLGSQVTQLMALAVLDDMDHYIKEELRIRGYVRYMDDFLLLHPDKDYLKQCKAQIERFLGGIGLTLNKDKTQIFPLTQGIRFLGFTFRTTETGKIIRKLRRSNVVHEKRKLRKMKRLAEQGILTREHVDVCFISWKAHASKGNTHHLIKNMNAFYERLWGD